MLGDQLSGSFFPPALQEAVEVLGWSGRLAVERPLPRITLLRDFVVQPLERYVDYEEDSLGELRAQSTLTETFGMQTTC